MAPLKKTNKTAPFHAEHCFLAILLAICSYHDEKKRRFRLNSFSIAQRAQVVNILTIFESVETRE